ncbi:SipW-dependent-type signal peptide-containing protein [Candidatus Woesebacteria bacterium]|nr:SipW-dependent-type signal peptide-containing protein [Candidatus Woesebacteria bacterium]
MASQKKTWISIALIVSTIGVGALGTWAFFTATRTNSDNTFTAGTLDLSVTGDNNIVNEPFVIENIGATGDISGTKTWTIENTGSLPGRLLVRLNNLANQENGCNDQEKGTEPACDADTEGELGGVITLNVALNGTNVVSSTLATDQGLVIGDDWNDTVTPLILDAGETATITMSWATDENDYGNEIQSDSLTFDSVFQLIQIINGPTPINRG